MKPKKKYKNENEERMRISKSQSGDYSATPQDEQVNFSLLDLRTYVETRNYERENQVQENEASFKAKQQMTRYKYKD